MIDKIKSYVKSKCDSYEIFLDNATQQNIEISNTKIDFISQGSSQGLGIRVEIGKKIGFSSTTDINNFKKCVDNAIKIAKLNKKDSKFEKFAISGTYKKVKVYYKDLASLSLEDCHDFINSKLEIIKNAKVNVTGGSYGRSVGKSFILNSEGVDLFNEYTINEFDYELLKGNVSYDGGDSGRGILKVDKLNEDLEILEKLKNKKVMSTLDCPVLMNYKACAEMIDSFFSGNLSGFNVQQKQSCFEEKLGQTLFSNKFTLIDDGSKGVFPSNHDSEGTPCGETILVSKGKLIHYLYDSYSANIDKVKSTANGFRGYASTPSIGFSNVFIEKGNKSFEKMVSSIDKGVIIDGMMGYHTVNDLTGAFSLSISNGFYVDKGEIKYPIKDCMLAGNFFELLKNIEMVENKQNKNYSFNVPSILFKNAKVIGS